MRKVLGHMACLAFALVALTGCIPGFDVEMDFSIDDIYGKWRSGTLYYRYDYGYKGVTWDTSDDVSEDEGQRFTWEIDGADMTHIYIMEMGSNVPKTYILDELTPTSLKYHDPYGKYYRFSKVGY